MNNASPIEQLNDAIDALVLDASAQAQDSNPEIGECVEVARELRLMPSADFRARLKAELHDHALAIKAAKVQPQAPTVGDDILPTLFGEGYGNYPIHRLNLAASFVLHAAAAALIVSSGLWVAQHRSEVHATLVTHLIEPSDIALPVAPDVAGGGGGGGDRDLLPASKGVPPRFAREQLTPPAVVIRNPSPKLPAEPTVVGAPQLSFRQLGPVGDPLSAVLGPPSNGVGSGGGIGSGYGGGVGSGYGPGVGPGRGGGYGGGVYRVGAGVSAPKAIYDPDPDYSDEARKARYQGAVIIWAIIGPDGRPRDLKVARSLGMGLDEKALEAVSKWRFSPAMKDGQPVAVQVNVEVNFRLY